VGIFLRLAQKVGIMGKKKKAKSDSAGSSQDRRTFVPKRDRVDLGELQNIRKYFADLTPAAKTAILVFHLMTEFEISLSYLGCGDSTENLSGQVIAAILEDNRVKGPMVKYASAFDLAGKLARVQQ
jgi:hypothetical protein